ncbi:MAG: ATP synthase F1 subunit gamma [Bacteroidales bacterium]|nr:ATP synthase F1 subunit gamma [Bacteroidales bacterium]
MPSLKDVRVRIKSVISTQQITSAMKMVSASKLRRAQDAILKLRPYANKMKELLGNLSEGVDISGIDAYSKERKKIEKILIVAVTSNKGLCGAFNSNVIKKTLSLINSKYAEQNKKGNVNLICIGRKGSDYFVKRNYKGVTNYNSLLDAPRFEKVVDIAEEIMKDYRTGKYDKVEIVYNMFKNAAVQYVTEEQFLPLQPIAQANQNKLKSDYILEPSKEIIVKELIPKSLKIQLYKVILDSLASEHGARMTAMHKATDNATEMLKELRLMYNKVRQASITKEILEIVSGANALKG